MWSRKAEYKHGDGALGNRSSDIYAGGELVGI